MYVSDEELGSSNSVTMSGCRTYICMVCGEAVYVDAALNGRAVDAGNVKQTPLQVCILLIPIVRVLILTKCKVL